MRAPGGRLPNQLAHFAVQGALSRAAWRRLDPRWIYLGCLLPDVPWILIRVATGLSLPVDRIDLRLYAMAQASLAGTLLLAAAAAALARAPRLVLAALGANAFAHLLLDASEVKWGNGVHLLAPVSWRMTRLELFSNQSPLNLTLTLAGLLLILWELARPARRDRLLVAAPRRAALSAALVTLYLVAPVLLLDAVEASNSYSVATLRDRSTRTGRALELDRARFLPGPEGGALVLWTGERLRVKGRLPEREAMISLKGVFTGPGELRVDALVEHRLDRDWPSYAALVLLALLLGRGARAVRPPHRETASSASV